MRLTWKSFSICKDGNNEEENEDAVYPVLPNGNPLIQDTFKCAMADGATSTSFSKLWANLVASESIQSNNLQKDISSVLSTSQKKWRAELSKKNLSWPAEIKVKQGAFCTLLWFRINSYHEWMACGVGDTCIFQIRKGWNVISYPLTWSSQFSNSAELISSNQLGCRAISSSPPMMDGWEKGDTFIIATDALSEWFLRSIEKNEDAFQIIKNNTSSTILFKHWITAMRKKYLIKNDDTTLIWLNVDE